MHKFTTTTTQLGRNFSWKNCISGAEDFVLGFCSRLGHSSRCLDQETSPTSPYFQGLFLTVHGSRCEQSPISTSPLYWDLGIRGCVWLFLGQGDTSSLLNCHLLELCMLLVWGRCCFILSLLGRFCHRFFFSHRNPNIFAVASMYPCCYPFHLNGHLRAQKHL